jgi:hypothetical protein
VVAVSAGGSATRCRAGVIRAEVMTVPTNDRAGQQVGMAGMTVMTWNVQDHAAAVASSAT